MTLNIASFSCLVNIIVNDKDYRTYISSICQCSCISFLFSSCLLGLHTFSVLLLFLNCFNYFVLFLLSLVPTKAVFPLFRSQKKKRKGKIEELNQFISHLNELRGNRQRFTLPIVSSNYEMTLLFCSAISIQSFS